MGRQAPATAITVGRKMEAQLQTFISVSYKKRKLLCIAQCTMFCTKCKLVYRLLTSNVNTLTCTDMGKDIETIWLHSAR